MKFDDEMKVIHPNYNTVEIYKKLKLKGYHFTKDYIFNQYDFCDFAYEYYDGIFDPITIQKYGLKIIKLGDFKNNIVFPIFDQYKNILAFAIRILEPRFNVDDKFFYSDGFNKKQWLYGLWNVDFNSDYLIITEGKTGTLLLNEMGFNAASLFGVEVRSAQLQLLEFYNFKKYIIIPDNDYYGHKWMSGGFQNSKLKNYNIIIFDKDYRNIQDIDRNFIRNEINKLI